MMEMSIFIRPPYTLYDICMNWSGFFLASNRFCFKDYTMVLSRIFMHRIITDSKYNSHTRPGAQDVYSCEKGQKV